VICLLGTPGQERALVVVVDVVVVVVVVFVDVVVLVVVADVVVVVAVVVVGAERRSGILAVCPIEYCLCLLMCMSIWSRLLSNCTQYMDTLIGLLFYLRITACLTYMPGFPSDG
jgi:hypothetical protein